MNVVSIDVNNTKAYATINVGLQGKRGRISLGPSTALMDTGAALNCISTQFVKRNKIPLINVLDTDLKSITSTNKLRVCSTLTGVDCTAVEKIAKISVEHVGTPIESYIADFIVGAFNDDIIIGRPTLANYNVLLGYPDQFFNLSPGQASALREILVSPEAASHIPAPHLDSTSCICRNKPTGGGIDDDQPADSDKCSHEEPSAKPKTKRSRADITGKNVQPRQTVQLADGEGNSDTSGRTSPLDSEIVISTLNNTTPEVATQERSKNSPVGGGQSSRRSF